MVRACGHTLRTRLSCHGVRAHRRFHTHSPVDPFHLLTQTNPPITKPPPHTAFGEPKTVCVRRAETAEAVEEVVVGLRNTTGRKVKPLKRPVVSRLQSIQVCNFVCVGWVGGEVGGCVELLFV